LGAVNARAGIEKIGVYPGSLCLRMADLCAARGADPAPLREAMMIDERSVNPLWEDPVSTAVNAADSILTGEDRERIELLIVASESGVDQEKALSTWVHRYLGLTPHCRNVEIKHACYGGTAGLQLAAGWILSGLSRGAKALIVATDQSRMHLGKPWEYVMGAGAAAVLVSDEPRIVEIEPGRSGYWTHEVSDLTRPTSRVETGNSETSLVSYLEALDNAFSHFLERVPEASAFESFFQRNVYHAPFGGMTFRAHKTLLRRFRAMSKREIQESFAERTLRSLDYLRRMGGTYSASTFIGLLGLMHDPGIRPGDRISMFSYGSGCCAEFYSVRACAGAREAVLEAGAAELLDARYTLTVPEYERVETARTALVDAGDYCVPLDGPGSWYERAYRGRRRLVFLGMKDYYRQYGWSA
jgi:3-hydroxy-3-methylglutaryl CoA synthase